MALVDVYELRFSGLAANENWNSIFHVLRDNGSLDAQDMVSVAVNGILPLFLLACPTSTTCTKAAARSLGDPLDFYEASLVGQSGQRTGDSLGSFVGPWLRFTRKRNDMHHGYKRLPGLSETDVTGGVIQAGLTTALTNLANELVAFWHEPGTPATAVCTYIIVKRVLDAGKYRLPEIDAELVYYAPSNYAIGASFTTQNSRKPGQ